MCHRNKKEETRAQPVNKDDSELVNSNQMEIWARKLLQNGDNDSSQFSDQVAVVGYKPSFKQNKNAVKEFNNKKDEFFEDNEIHDKTIKYPNSTKSEMSDSKMVEAMQKTI